MIKNLLILKYALLIFGFITLYFIVLNIFGLSEIRELRLLNILIVIFFSIRMAKEEQDKETGVDYLYGFFSIFLANLLAVGLSIGAMAIYLVAFPNSTRLFESWIFGGEPDVLKVLISILLEGSAAAIIVSFSVMQYYKKETSP